MSGNPLFGMGDDIRTNNRGFVLACAKDEMGRSPETAAGKPSPTTKGVFKNDVGSAVAGSAIDERLPPSERESCVGMPWHGVALPAASPDDWQCAGAIPVCHPSDANNVLALNN